MTGHPAKSSRFERDKFTGYLFAPIVDALTDDRTIYTCGVAAIQPHHSPPRVLQCTELSVDIVTNFENVRKAAGFITPSVPFAERRIIHMNKKGTMVWDDMLTDVDRIVIQKGGYGQPRGFGKRPLLICIDLQPNYIGADAPIETQLDEWPSGGGAKAWEGVRRILSLRDAARKAGVPVFYTRNVQNSTAVFDNFAGKRQRDNAKFIDGHPCSALLECVAPLPEEMVIPKSYASAFYGTPLQSYLITLGIDTVIIVGGSTGGCCRATAVDAATRSYRLICVEDCLFDRIEVSHKAALLDIWMKYGDVVDSAAVKKYFRTLAVGVAQ